MSKQEHLERSLNRLVEIIAASNPVGRNVVMETYQAVEAMVFDNSPTPKIAYVGGGALEIEWLVGGRSLTISCSPEEGIEAWATDANGDLLFEGEPLPIERFLSSTWKNQGLKLLKSMSRELRNQSFDVPLVSILAD
ncbi:hypothetical protein [Subtercola lobariae]|uniref:hypothetical protein n=1 Tax=Subtercola lobariae TaxID=1588641 RepID=UPI001941FFB5|nr:hypothetical protein [Subtercola lobariae]